MTTFEIIEKIKEIDLLSQEVNEETGEFIYTEDEINSMYAEIEATKEDKLIAIEDYKRLKKKEIEFFEEKKKKQEANIKRTKASIEYMKGLQDALLNGKKLKTDEYTFSYRKSSSVNVYDVDQLPKNCYKLEKKPISAEIKKAIKQAKKNKESFFGAEIVENKSLSVR